MPHSLIYNIYNDKFFGYIFTIRLHVQKMAVFSIKFLMNDVDKLHETLSTNISTMKVTLNFSTTLNALV